MRRLFIGVGALIVVVVVAACGGNGSSDTARSTTPTTAAPAGTGTTFSGRDSGEFCGLVRTYRDRLSGLTAANTTQAQVRQLATDLDSAIQQAVVVAPAEIKTDVTLVANAAADYLAALQRAGYDFAKMPQDAAAKFQAPDVVAASGRLQDYSRSVCGTG